VTVKSSLLSLVFTDLVDSTALKTQLGDGKTGALIARHQERVRGLIHELAGREIDVAGDVGRGARRRSGRPRRRQPRSDVHGNPRKQPED
jgi:class 3 adenylate cyclase